MESLFLDFYEIADGVWLSGLDETNGLGSTTPSGLNGSNYFGLSLSESDNGGTISSGFGSELTGLVCSPVG